MSIESFNPASAESSKVSMHGKRVGRGPVRVRARFRDRRMLGRLLALSLVLGAALSPLALASRDSGDHDEHERRDRSPHTSREHRRHQRDTLDALSEAVRRGEVLPLWQVKARVIEAFGSRIIDVDIEREDGVWVYEFKVIGEHGRLLEIYVDARSGRVIEIEND